LPRLAAATVEDNERVGRESVRVVAFVMTPATLVLLIVLGPFLLLWLGQATGAAATPVAFVLMAGIWANCLAAIALTSMVARGRPDLLAKIYLFEIVPYLLVLGGALYFFGIVGAALAWSLRCATDAVLLLYFMKLDAPTRRHLAFHFAVVIGGSGLAFGLLDQPVARIAALSALICCVAIVLVRNVPASLIALLDQASTRLIEPIKAKYR
jgi:O-antigen/teichoic acid export membrane protein